MTTNKKRIDAQNVKLYGISMDKVENFKYLGIWLDQKGTWRTQVENIEFKYKKVINICVYIYIIYSICGALMRSTIDYGCMVYGAAAKMHLCKNRVINKALRICAGVMRVMRTSSTKTIHVELGEVPIELRRGKMLLEYWSRLQGCGYENPAKTVNQECRENGI